MTGHRPRPSMRPSTHATHAPYTVHAAPRLRRLTAPAAEPPQQPSPPQQDVGPAEAVVWGGTLPSGRRAVLGTLSAAGIAFGGNLGGVTSAVLETQPAAARAVRLDAVFPVGGFLRHVDTSNGFEFLHPEKWLADQTLARRQAQRIEAQMSLDPPSLSRRQRRASAEPVVAFGPPGSSGEVNMSCVVQDANAFGVLFTLAALGSPQQLAQGLFDNVIARPGSNKTATLIAATERADGSYALEYTVESTGQQVFQRHFLSVLTGTKAGTLLTFTIQVPEAVWREQEGMLRPCADSWRAWDA